MSKALAFVEFLKRDSNSGEDNKFKPLTLSVVTGVLQSLVDATPFHLGAIFLRGLYKDLHALDDPTLRGTKAYYYTLVQLSTEALVDLGWWDQALRIGLQRQVQCKVVVLLMVTHGDGSGYGTGGTSSWVTPIWYSPVHTWLGVWSTRVLSFTSNWKELSTITATMERILRLGIDFSGHILIYFTDSDVTHNICRKSYGSKNHLMEALCNIRILEFVLGCRLIIIYVPGKVLITKGTDGLSRGVQMHPFGGQDGVSTIAP